MKALHRLPQKVLTYFELPLYNFSLALVEMLCTLPEAVGYKYIQVQDGVGPRTSMGWARIFISPFPSLACDFETTYLTPDASVSSAVNLG